MGTPFGNVLQITHKIESGRIVVRLSLQTLLTRQVDFLPVTAAGVYQMEGTTHSVASCLLSRWVQGRKRRGADSLDKSSIIGFIAQVFESSIHREIQQIVLALIVRCLQVLKDLYLLAKPSIRYG